MSTFRIYFTTGASATVTVEANDLEDAIEKAYDELPSDICAQCSGWGQEWSRDLGDEWTVDETAYEQDGEYIEVES